MAHMAHHCQLCLPVSESCTCVSHLARHCRIHSRASCTLGFKGAWLAGGDAPLPCAGAGASSSCEPVCAPRRRPLTSQHAVPCATCAAGRHLAPRTHCVSLALLHPNPQQLFTASVQPSGVSSPVRHAKHCGRQAGAHLCPGHAQLLQPGEGPLADVADQRQAPLIALRRHAIGLLLRTSAAAAVAPGLDPRPRLLSTAPLHHQAVHPCTTEHIMFARSNICYWRWCSAAKNQDTSSSSPNKVHRFLKVSCNVAGCEWVPWEQHRAWPSCQHLQEAAWQSLAWRWLPLSPWLPCLPWLSLPPPCAPGADMQFIPYRVDPKLALS